MKTLKVSYLKLDLNHYVLNYNDNFCQLFNLESKQDDFINKPIKHILQLKNLLSRKILKSLNAMQINEIESMILIKNNRINAANIDNAILFLYVVITRNNDSYVIRVVNWLNWLHDVHLSLTNSYSFVSGLNGCIMKNDFSRISDASCFKAFYPLITHIPNKFSHGISQAVLFDIMHLFVKQRYPEKCTKDYARNVYSRLRTNLKKEFNLDNIDIVEFIKNDKILTLRYNDDIQIPNTTITRNISQTINHDPLLLSFINAIHPN